MVETQSHSVYLAPAEYVDSDHPDVCAAAAALTQGVSAPKQKARALYAFVRDVRYHIGAPFEDLANYRASRVLALGRGYCVAKASLFVALCRAAAIPARLGFADVTNHLASPDVAARMGSDLYAWHGYAEVWLAGRWLKASPTFDKGLCARLGVAPLEFDGERDALLQAFDAEGRTFMRYETFHGTFHDVPAKFFAAEIPRLYPKMCAAIRAGAYDRPPEPIRFAAGPAERP